MKTYNKKNILTVLLGLLLIGVSTQTVLAVDYVSSIPYIVNGSTPPPPSLSVTLAAAPNVLTLPSNQTTLTWAFPVGTPTVCGGTSSPSTSWNGSSPSVAGGSQVVGGLTAGSYIFSISCTDGTNTATDSALVVVNSSGPDLVASSITPYVATINVPLSFSGMITNQGNVTTGASFPSFFQVASAAMGGGTVVDLAPTTISTLAAGASTTTGSPSYTFISTGIKSVRLCADKSSSSGGGTIAESDESNNCGPWTRVTVSPPQTTTPSVTLSAAPSAIFTGNASTLSWVSSNVTSCTASASPASGSWTGSRPTASVYPHESTGPLAVTTTFMIDCTGPYGAASSQAKVNVTAKGTGVSVNLTATPDRISPGDSSVLAWSSANATSCTGNFPTGGATAGTFSVNPIVNTTYKIQCTDGTNDASAQATVTLKRRFLFIEY